MQSSRSSSRQGVSVCVDARQAFQTFSRSRAHKDVELFSFHKGHQHCVQLICSSIRRVSRGITTFVAVFASATVANSLSTAHVKTPLAPGCTLHDEVLSRSCLRYELTLRVLQRWKHIPDLSYPPRSDWFVPDLLRPTLLIPLFAQETVANLTKLG